MTHRAPGAAVDTNVLYYGDNLDILRHRIGAATVDLVYLDPPFNSNADYSAIFKDESGRKSDAQIEAFEDTWHWGPEAERILSYLVTSAEHQGKVPDRVSVLMDAMVRGVGRNPMTAYLVNMAVRLLEMHRVLKTSGSLYLHCDPTASHYLKLVLDAIFGPDQFVNEIIWHYRKWPTGKYTFQRNHDVLLFYAKGPPAGRTFNQLYMERAASTLKRFGTAKIVSGHDAAGRRVPSTMAGGESLGVRQDDVWPIPRVAPVKQLYPTQKPVALLERIIEASTNPGDVVLDPFCGCGTALIAAHKLDRRWIGIDVTSLAITVMRARLRDAFGLEYVPAIGEPRDLRGAYDLRDEPNRGRKQFELWALSLVDALPSGKQSADEGVDGKISFTDDAAGMKQILVSVKSGDRVGVKDIRDLKGAMDRERAAMGLYITLAEPTKPMVKEAASAGMYDSPAWNRTYPRVQIATIEKLLKGIRPDLPAYARGAFGRADRERRGAGEQEGLGLDDTAPGSAADESEDGAGG